MKTAHLSLCYEPDCEDLGQIVVHVKVGNYSGSAAAWIRKADLQDFAERIATYPLPDKSPVGLDGGWIMGDQTEFRRRPIRIDFFAHDPLGKLLICVELASFGKVTGWSEIEDRLSVSFLTTYSDIARFRSELAASLEGGPAACLNGETT